MLYSSYMYVVCVEVLYDVVLVRIGGVQLCLVLCWVLANEGERFKINT